MHICADEVLAVIIALPMVGRCIKCMILKLKAGRS